MNTVDAHVQWWQGMAKEFGIVFEAPFVLEHAGTSHTFLGRLPEFGAKRGMLLMFPYEDAAAQAAAASGFGYTCVRSPENMDKEYVVEMLQDWGWSSDAQPPGWYREV